MLAQTTHVTLLVRLREGQDSAAWQEFCHRYGDLVRNVGRHHALQPADCEDVLQDVLLSLTRTMPGFAYDPGRGKFRSYLKTVTLHAIFAKLRQKKGEVPLQESGSGSNAGAPAATGDGEDIWESQWRQHHLRLAMHTIDVEFNEADRAAFRQYALEGRDAASVADSLHMSVDQVYQAKSRILRRLGEVIQHQVAEEG